MAITVAINVTGIKRYTVLRPICIAGERVEVGDAVELSLTQYTELATAGKVGPFVAKAKADNSKSEKQADKEPEKDLAK